MSRLAQVLLEEGVGPGDAVGIQLPNTVEIVVAVLAIVRIGAIVAPFPVQYRAYELTHLSEVAQVQAFLTASRIGQRPAAAELAGLRSQIGSLRWVGAFGPDLPDGVIGLDERIEAADDRGGLARTWRPGCRIRTTASRSAGPPAPRALPRACSAPTTTGCPCATARWKGRS